MMNVAHLRRWDLTAIEIALDLEVPSFPYASRFGFTGAAEPRICLVVALALTAQLKHIAAAVGRVLPAHLPPALLIAPPQLRNASSSPGGLVSIRQMPALIRMQSRLVRAIKPGLAETGSYDMADATSRYIREFIPTNALPALEPSHVGTSCQQTAFRTLGITFYRLDRNGKPQSILGHWAYGHNAVAERRRPH